MKTEPLAVLLSRVNLSWMKATRSIANFTQLFLQRRGGRRFQRAPRKSRRDVTNISPEHIDAPRADERKTVLVVVAGIFLIALVINYAGYCFYATAEKIKETSERGGINLQ
jgi:hypothetical protein